MLEGALATVRARCELWVYPGSLPVVVALLERPPGRNKHYWKPPGFIGSQKSKSWKTGLVLATPCFSGSMGCLGGCIVGWCTGVRPRIVAAARMRCNNTLKGQWGGAPAPPSGVGWGGVGGWGGWKTFALAPSHKTGQSWKLRVPLGKWPVCASPPPSPIHPPPPRMGPIWRGSTRTQCKRLVPLEAQDPFGGPLGHHMDCCSKGGCQTWWRTPPCVDDPVPWRPRLGKGGPKIALWGGGGGGGHGRPAKEGGGGFQKWASVPGSLFCVRTDVGAKGAGTQFWPGKFFFTKKFSPTYV